MFINLHTHDSKGSVRDAIAIPEQITARVKELGQTAYAITNHGSTSSLLTHYKLAKKAGLKFVFGLEAYICTHIGIKDRDYKHICLFAKDMTGYLNILKMATISYDKGFYYKPRIDGNILREHLDGLIISSACLGGILVFKKEDGSLDEMATYEELLKCKNDFGDNFYVEFHTNQMQEQIEFNKLLYKMCNDLNITNIIATCDAHYVLKEQAWIHRYWNGIDENDEQAYYQTDDFYLHSEDEVYKALSYLPKEFVKQCVDNTVKLTDRCNVELKFGEDNFPIYKCDSQIEKVKEICRIGWKDKIIPFIPKDNRQVYLDRFLEEMNILEKANYLNMMLITWDYMKWGQDHGIRFGVGRGSVGGSLVAYLMDITKVDPVKNNLYFSRFCNLHRVTTADIDVDVMQRERHRVIEYLREKYGYVYQVRTFTSMKPKAALQKAGMCLGIQASKIRELSKLVNEDKNLSDGEKFNDIPLNTEENKKLVKLAKAFLGIISNTSVHASAVLVFPKDPTNFCAIERKGETFLASYDYHELEELGLAKIDVLGLKNMDIIQDTLDLLKANGNEINLNTIPTDDKKTAELLCNAETAGVFQIESNMMRGLVKEIQPKCFEDLTAIVALGRPAVLSCGIDKEYIKERKIKLGISKSKS